VQEAKMGRASGMGLHRMHKDIDAETSYKRPKGRWQVNTPMIYKGIVYEVNKAGSE
jgi:hypothetical protein